MTSIFQNPQKSKTSTQSEILVTSLIFHTKIDCLLLQIKELCNFIGYNNFTFTKENFQKENSIIE